MKNIFLGVSAVAMIGALAWSLALAGETLSYEGGLFSKSPDDSCWKLDVSNAGVVSTSSDTANAPYCA